MDFFFLVLDVAGNISHPWLDEYKRVIGSSKLNNWNKHSVLTEVVEETLSAVSFYFLYHLFSQLTISKSKLSLATIVNASSNVAPVIQNVNASGYPSSYVTAAPVSYPGPAAIPIRQSNSNSNLVQPQPSFYPTQQMNNQPTASNVSTYSVYEPNAAKKSNETKSDQTPQLKEPAFETKDYFDPEGEKSPIPLPEIPQSFPELEKLTNVQLERLLTDEVALEVNKNAVPF